MLVICAHRFAYNNTHHSCASSDMLHVLYANVLLTLGSLNVENRLVNTSFIWVC